MCIRFERATFGRLIRDEKTWPLMTCGVDLRFGRPMLSLSLRSSATTNEENAEEGQCRDDDNGHQFEDYID